MSFYEINNYDPNYGLDVDDKKYDENYQLLSDNNSPNAVYGDYETLLSPTTSGFNVLVDPSNRVPNIDDYIVNPDGSKTLKSFLSDNQGSDEDPLDLMVDNINNGRMSDVKNLSDVTINENIDIIINKNNKETSIKGLLEKNSMNDLFFSELNIKTLNDTIRYKVYKNTDKIISNQSQNELYIIMRSIILQNGNFAPDVEKITDEIRKLNKLVTEYCVNNISTNVKQYLGYLDEISKLPVPLDRPVYHNKNNFTYDISNII
jgi:hypothetical protein